jgi:hypothetical protein
MSLGHPPVHTWKDHFPWVLNSGSAAVLLLGNSILLKVGISMCRITKKYEADDKFVNCYRPAQLNETEYTSLTLGALLYLKSMHVEARISSTLIAVSNLLYVWCRILFGNTKQPGEAFPSILTPWATIRFEKKLY